MEVAAYLFEKQGYHATGLNEAVVGGGLFHAQLGPDVSMADRQSLVWPDHPKLP